MKQITTFDASRYSASWTFYRLRYSALALLVIIGMSALTNAQSKDRDNPTRLTSNEISGVIDSDSKGSSYYYSFMAGPGEVSITLTVEPGREMHPVGSPGLKSVIFTLFDRNAETLTSKEAATYDGGEPKQVVARVEVNRRQLVLLGIKIPGGAAFDGVGKYRVRISGTVDFPTGGNNPGAVRGSDFDTPIRLATDKKGDCLPKQGTLIVKMKDGTKKIIDLSEAEEVTIVP